MMIVKIVTQMKMIKLLVLLFILLIPNLSYAQHQHDDLNVELGVSSGPSLVIGDDFGLSLHSHLMMSIPETLVSLGFGFERLFHSHAHNTFGIVSQINVVDNLNIAISPGLTFDDSLSEMLGSIHFETVYNFMITDTFHLGPVAEVAVDAEDTHISLGLHTAWDFVL